MHDDFRNLNMSKKMIIAEISFILVTAMSALSSGGI